MPRGKSYQGPKGRLDSIVKQHHTKKDWLDYATSKDIKKVQR